MKEQYKASDCGRQILVTNVGSAYGVGGVGNSIIATVQDTCESCDEGHVDFSVGAWNALTGDAPYGLLDIEW